MFVAAGAVSSQLGIINSFPNLLGEGINITGLNDVWRKDTASSFSISVPTGYQCQYQIIESESLLTGNPIIETQGTTSGGVTYTFTTAMKQYFIRVIATKGSLRFVRWFVPGITVLPPLFTEGQANAVWDFSNGGVFYRDNNLVDRTNYKVFCKGIANTGQYLGLEEWISTLPDQPVHILASPGTQVQINSTNVYTARINQNCQNLLLDGCGDPNIRYGFRFAFTGTGSKAQLFYIEASTNAGSTANTAGRNITVCGLQLDGIGISSAGVKVDTANSAAVNYFTYDPLAANLGGALGGLRLFRMQILGTLDEGLYCGYVHDLTHGTPAFASAPIVGARIYDFHTLNTGGDGLQLGASMFDSWVYRCTVTNAGSRNDPSHKNGLQFSSGNRNLAVFMNRIYSCKNLHSVATGRAGSNVEVFANILQNPTVDSNNHTQTFFRVDQNDTFLRINAKYFNNTLILAENRPWEGWNAASTGITTKLDWVNINNAIVTDTTTPAFAAFNNIDTSTWIFSNYSVNNGLTPQFVDYTGGDYHPATLSSPLFQTLAQTTAGAHPLWNCDYDGYEYTQGIKGAFSGTTLFT